MIGIIEHNAVVFTPQSFKLLNKIVYYNSTCII